MTQQTFESPINLNIGQLPDTRNPELYKELALVYNALRILQQGVTGLTGAVSADPSVWNTIQPADTLLAGNLHRFYCQAGVAIGYGQLVKFADNGVGGVAAALATATGTNAAAEGVCITPGGVALNDFGEFIVGEGLVDGYAGLVPGTRYWLSTVSGNITNIKPSAALQLGQYVGTAISTTQLYIRLGSALAAASAQF